MGSRPFRDMSLQSSTLGNEDSVYTLKVKLKNLEVMGSRLYHFTVNDACLLLWNSFSASLPVTNPSASNTS